MEVMRIGFGDIAVVSRAGSGLTRGLRGAGLAVRWARLVDGLRGSGGGTEESAASFSKQARRELVARRGAVSMPSDCCGAFTIGSEGG